MDLLQIKYFIAVAKNLSYTKAAQSLFTTQPTVSKQIALLEKELDVQLFERSRQYVRLTPPGELLYHEFSEIVKRMDTVLENVKSISRGLEGKLNIGIYGLLDINRLIPNLFTAFTCKFPNIDLAIKSYNFRELRENLLNGNLDLIFTFSLEQVDNNMVRRAQVSRTNSRIYFSTSLPVAAKGNLSLKDFQSECFIMHQLDESPLSSIYSSGICKKYGFTPKKVIFTNTLETTLFYVESGLGVAILGSSFRLRQNDKISSLEIDDKDFMVGTDALWLKENDNPALNVFSKELSMHLK